LDTKDNGTGTKNYNDINSEKYNIPVRSAVVTGAKVLNNVTKNDIMNNPRVSETLFTI
jgi:hypothetical protein